MNFPTLSTGAVIQHPARRSVEYSTEVLRFLDGSEQRFRRRGTQLHRWSIRLDLLNEDEMETLRQFFAAAQGRQGSFAFVDPWDGTRYPDCSLDDDSLDLEFSGEMRGHTNIVVKENP